MKLSSKIITLVLILVASSFASNLMNFVIGPTWPKALKNTPRPVMWNGAFEIGHVFDEKFIVGVKADFAWDIVKHYNSDSSQITYSDKTFMFPISGFFALDPIPQYMFHPVARVQVGYNSATFSTKENVTTTVIDTSTTPFDTTYTITLEDSPKNGYYYGIIAKVGIDGVVDLGKHASLFAGFEWQFSELKNSDKYIKPMSGPGVRMGVSVLY